MKKSELIKTIIAVLKYEDHDHATGVFNVGQLAKDRVRDMLSLHREDSLTYAIQHAKIKELREVYDYLEKYIEHMIKYPVEKCPLCQTLSRQVNFRKNTFVVELAENYIPTLVSHVGRGKAIKRIVEEASVSLKIQAAQAIDNLAKK